MMNPSACMGPPFADPEEEERWIKRRRLMGRSREPQD